MRDRATQPSSPCATIDADMKSTDALYIFAAVAGLVTLGVWMAWIVIPAWRAYGTWWERSVAAVLSVYVLAALLLAGAAIGVALLFYSRI